MPTRLHALTTHETRFRAMGTDTHVVVVDGPEALLRLAADRIAELERRWSRFLPTSEVSGLNRHAGHPVVVSEDTYELVMRATTAWRATEGRFDPTVGAALFAAGYDRDFAEVARSRPMAASTGPCPTPALIDLDPILDAVTLPEGVVFDPGGIGKGLAADMTASALHEGGAAGALVNLGGDLRAVGQPPTPEGWVVTVEDPVDSNAELLRLAIPGGAVATSSRLRRRWDTATGEAHHLIDPLTGDPIDNDVIAVSVVAGEAWWAEVLTKSLFVLGPSGLDTIGPAHAVVIMSDGTRHATAGLEAALR